MKIGKCIGPSNLSDRVAHTILCATSLNSQAVQEKQNSLSCSSTSRSGVVHVEQGEQYCEIDSDIPRFAKHRKNCECYPGLSPTISH